MQIVYHGPQPSRTVELGHGRRITVEHGKPVTVPERVGERLVRQRHFDAAPAKKAPAKKAKSATTTTKE